MGAMGILGRIAIGVVHPVQNGISPGRQVGTSLAYPGEDIKKPFPYLAHDKHLMGGITVEEKALTKQREIPMEDKYKEYDHFGELSG